MQAKYLLSSPPELTSASDNKLTIHTIIRSHADNTLSISYVENIPFFAKKEWSLALRLEFSFFLFTSKNDKVTIN